MAEQYKLSEQNQNNSLNDTEMRNSEEQNCNRKKNKRGGLKTEFL